VFFPYLVEHTPYYACRPCPCASHLPRRARPTAVEGVTSTGCSTATAAHTWPWRAGTGYTTCSSVIPAPAQISPLLVGRPLVRCILSIRKCRASPSCSGACRPRCCCCGLESCCPPSSSSFVCGRASTPSQHPALVLDKKP
jgi:hypothetical protein